MPRNGRVATASYSSYNAIRSTFCRIDDIPFFSPAANPSLRATKNISVHYSRYLGNRNIALHSLLYWTRRTLYIGLIYPESNNVSQKLFKPTSINTVCIDKAFLPNVSVNVSSELNCLRKPFCKSGTCFE